MFADPPASRLTAYRCTAPGAMVVSRSVLLVRLSGCCAVTCRTAVTNVPRIVIRSPYLTDIIDIVYYIDGRSAGKGGVVRRVQQQRVGGSTWNAQEESRKT
jgi:hypothetical protein